MNYFGYLAVFFHFEQMWLRGELRVYGAERHRRLCEIQPLPYRAPSAVCTGSVPLGKLLLQQEGGLLRLSDGTTHGTHWNQPQDK